MIHAAAPSDHDLDDLFARAQAGDEAAWRVLFQTCYPKVIRVVRRKLDPPMRRLYDSQDFASDVMKSLAANAAHLNFTSFNSLIAYLTKVAEGKVIDEYRRVHAIKTHIDRTTPLDGNDGGPLGVASTDPTASQIAVAAEAQEILLQGKTGPERAAIELREQGYSAAEVLQETGWHPRKLQRYLQSLYASYQQRH